MRCTEIRLDLEIYTEVSHCQPWCVFCCRHTHEWTAFYCSLHGIRLGVVHHSWWLSVCLVLSLALSLPVSLSVPPDVSRRINRQYTMIVQITNPGFYFPDIKILGPGFFCQYWDFNKWYMHGSFSLHASLAVVFRFGDGDVIAWGVFLTRSYSPSVIILPV